MSTGSPNKAVKSGLIETLQRKVEPAKLYDALKKMDDDINKTYEALFDGPLPAVDGFALTRLNPESLDGIILEVNLPNSIAFQDRDNIFSESNKFVVDDESAIMIGLGEVTVTTNSDGATSRSDDVTSWFRASPKASGEFFISQNYNWTGTDYELDDALLSGSIIEFVDGDIQIKSFLPADGIDYTSPYLADTWFFNGKEFGVANYAQDDEILFAIVNESDVILLGESAGEFTDLWRGHIAIPAKSNADLPPSAEPMCNGIICIDKTANDLIYYVNDLRYRLNGVAF